MLFSGLGSADRWYVEGILRCEELFTLFKELRFLNRMISAGLDLDF